MKVALVLWNGRISPVFDTARNVEVLEVVDGQVTGRQEMALGPDEPNTRAARLAELGVDTLVCGAVSSLLAGVITGRGIHLIPFVAGEAAEVLAAFMAGGLPDPALALPGCCGMRVRARRGGAGRGNCRGGRGNGRLSC
ncbi:MAG: NifB/NifX family molybdenum-iron cluster-binding protein [Planctomycetota bacterium]